MSTELYEGGMYIGRGMHITITYSITGELVLYCGYHDTDPVDGEKYPTGRGIYLTPADFANLMQLIPEFKTEMENFGQYGVPYHKHVNSGIYASLKRGRPFIEIRHFNRPDREKPPVEGRHGNIFTKEQLESMEIAFDNIRAMYEPFRNAQPTVCSGIHDETDKEAKCSYCNPFGPAKDVWQ